MLTDEKNNYFQELRRNLQQEGVVVCPEAEGLLTVELEGQRLCQITGNGAVRYWKDEVAGDSRSTALDKVTNIAKTTAEYMRLIEAAPFLTVGGLQGDYRVLADFNGIVLAGHPTEFGAQFITWELVRDRTGLYQGNYYGPSVGIDSYAAAKRDFATRSGLLPRSALFTPEQLTEVYRSIHEVLESTYPITDERQKCLQSVAEQIEHTVPDLDDRVSLSNQRELELDTMESNEAGGMKLC